MNNAKIKITTAQTIDKAGNEEVMELVTEAERLFQKDFIIINYDESDITENTSSKTRMKIYKDKLILTKVGDISSRMEFEENQSYSNIYSTPYGNFDLDFNTMIYENNLDEVGKGTVKIEYQVVFAGSEKSYNKLAIDIF